MDAWPFLFYRKSFVLSTLGFTCVAFVTGALALWAPSYMFNVIKAQGQDADEGKWVVVWWIMNDCTISSKKSTEILMLKSWLKSSNGLLKLIVSIENLHLASHISSFNLFNTKEFLQHWIKIFVVIRYF